MAGEAAIHGAPTSAQALLLLFLVPLVLLLIGAKRWSRRSKQRLNLPLPPSPPRALPVIGHLHLVGPLPHVSFRDLAGKHGRDLMLLRLGSVNTVVVSSPRAAAAVLRTHDHALASRSRSAVADIIFYKRTDVAFAPYGEPWRQARKVVTTHMLSAKKVHSFRHDREEEARITVAKIRAAAETAVPVDMSELLGSYANDVVCRAVLGRNHRDDGRNKLLRQLIDINMSLLGGFNVEDYFPSLAVADVFTGMVVCPRARRVRKRWDELLHKLIDEHGRLREQDDASADFIHVLLAQQEEYGLTTDNVKAILLDMFEAGTETTYLVLEFAMAELMNNRHVMAKLQAEVRRRRAPAAAVGKDDEGESAQDVVTEEELGDMAYLKATVKETLRLHPPVPLLLPHLSIADCEVDGYAIPAGTRLMVNAWALARDPASWEAPDEFAPERFLQGGSAAAVDSKGKDFEFLPFGSGRRICPGINFANTAVEMMLANLVYHFDWELPPGTKEVDMTEVFSLSIRRKEKLLLVPTRRSCREE
ncbi:indolin-2-one monooxygenase-like [Triticum urartu]|nr:indolin-2-one monooxygenase-like [Triticum urartu]